MTENSSPFLDLKFIVDPNLWVVGCWASSSKACIIFFIIVILIHDISRRPTVVTWELARLLMKFFKPKIKSEPDWFESLCMSQKSEVAEHAFNFKGLVAIYLRLLRSHSKRDHRIVKKMVKRDWKNEACIAISRTKNIIIHCDVHDMSTLKGRFRVECH